MSSAPPGRTAGACVPEVPRPRTGKVSQRRTQGGRVETADRRASMIHEHHLERPLQRSFFHAALPSPYDPGLGKRRSVREGQAPARGARRRGAAQSPSSELSTARTHCRGVRAGGATPAIHTTTGREAARYDCCGGASEPRTNERVATTQSIRCSTGDRRNPGKNAPGMQKREGIP